MLLCREFLVSAIRTIRPTYEDLAVVSEYIVLFKEKMREIVEIVETESKKSNGYGNLFYLYLINEMLSKGCDEEMLVELRKSVMKKGREELEKMKKSTEGFRKSAEELVKKYDEMEELWEGAALGKERGKRLPLDVEYLESLCRDKDKEKIMKYIRDIDG